MDERDYIAMNKELKTNSMNSAVEWIEDTIDKKHMGEYLQSVINQAKEIEVNLAQQYAEYSIVCDRREMNPIKFKDWCEQYDKKTI